MSAHDPVSNDGMVTAWGNRAFLFDARGGFFALRDHLAREIGCEFAADLFYRAGFAASESLAAFCANPQNRDPDASPLSRGLQLLTDGGYGRFELSEQTKGCIHIIVHNSVEAWTMREEDRAGFMCHYVRGLLGGLVPNLVRSAADGEPSEAIVCLETACLANGDPDCLFVAGTAEGLAAAGYRLGDRGPASVRETLLRLNRQLEEVLEAAQKDALTGLFNRAHFDSVLAHRIEHANRRTDTLSVAMIDVDGFKNVNDTLGHGVGDIALRQIGRLFGAQARDTDLVARYGGDEFAWLMPGTSPEAALAVADRIRRQVEELQSVHDLPLTLSIGIAACPQDAANPTHLMDLADQALYRAKDTGGNRVIPYEAPVTAVNDFELLSPTASARRKARRIIPR